MGLYLRNSLQWHLSVLIRTSLGNKIKTVIVTYYLAMWKWLTIIHTPTYCVTVLAGKPYWNSRLSTVVHFAVTSLKLPSIVQTLFSFFTKETSLMWRSIILSLPLELVSPFFNYCLKNLNVHFDCWNLNLMNFLSKNHVIFHKL